MADGFLGYKTSFMLDVVVCALVVLVPLLLFSLFQVRAKRNHRLHRKLQLVLGIVLGVAVLAFEVDLQILHQGWENIVHKRTITAEQLVRARSMLRIHLLFAVTTPLLWLLTIVLALRRFPQPPAPGPHSRLHRTLGWLSTVDLVMTSATGLVFYYLAFVAPGV